MGGWVAMALRPGVTGVRWDWVLEWASWGRLCGLLECTQTAESPLNAA